MKKDKLELTHLAPYLPYKLNVCDTSQDNHIFDLNEWLFREHQNVQPFFKNHFDQILNDDSLKIRLRQLSDLTKEEKIEDKFKSLYFGYMHVDRDSYGSYDDCVEYFSKHQDMNMIPKIIIDFMYKHHFDVYGLIDKNLATDINTL